MNKKTLLAFLILCLYLVACNVVQTELEAVPHFNRGAEYYENGELDRIGTDLDGDGEVDTWEQVREPEQEEPAEEPSQTPAEGEAPADQEPPVKDAPEKSKG